MSQEEEEVQEESKKSPKHTHNMTDWLLDFVVSSNILK